MIFTVSEKNRTAKCPIYCYNILFIVGYKWPLLQL